ncbi:MAG: hypothetical protein ACYTGL_26000 [Planctomycetota bacterium]|jgi:hypothetical protein
MPARSTFHLFLIVITLLPVISASATAADPDATSGNPDSRGRATAVALNYCKASFHRIRTYQSTRVLLEEQEKILDNLNLNGIGEQEVMNLYSTVLDEIGDIDIADREKQIFEGKYKKALFREIEATAFVALAQTATLSMDGLVRTGVRSWLDYRDLQWNREFDQWKVEKARLSSVVDKSTKFLDTFWKQAKAKNIPDKWLVRGTDLDQLTEAIQEPDLTVRLRILNRMKEFMECYPPYFYYLGRTQQGLGQFYEAAQTYDHLADLAHGHFRRDDMLTAALANRALIQQHLDEPGADRTAREALTYSTSVWEANLMCAQVLETYGRFDDAEDAILRNLDVELEQQNSSVALLGLYYRQNRLNDLAAKLADPHFMTRLPMLSLVQSIAKLGPQRTPAAVLNRLRTTLRVAIETRLVGLDDVLVACGPNWQPEKVRSLTFFLPGQVPANTGGNALPYGMTNPQLEPHETGGSIFRYSRAVDAGGNPFGSGSSHVSLVGSVLRFEYAAPPNVTEPSVLVVTMGPALPPGGGSQAAAPWWQSASPVEIRYGDVRVRLDGVSVPTADSPVARHHSGPQTDGRSNGPVQPPRPANENAASDSDSPQPSMTPVPQRPGNGRFEPSRRPPRAIILGVRPASGTSEPASRDDEPSRETVPPPPALD